MCIVHPVRDLAHSRLRLFCMSCCILCSNHCSHWWHFCICRLYSTEASSCLYQCWYYTDTYLLIKTITHPSWLVCTGPRCLCTSSCTLGQHVGLVVCTHVYLHSYVCQCGIQHMNMAPSYSCSTTSAALI